MTGPKPVVLPLHHGVFRGRFLLLHFLGFKSWIEKNSTDTWVCDLVYRVAKSCLMYTMKSARLSILFLACLASSVGATPEEQAALEVAIASHEQAVHLMPEVWMRDPFILRHGSWHYLTATRQQHVTWGEQGLELWRSQDFIHWESIGVPWSFTRSSWLNKFERGPQDPAEFWLLAPEIYFMDDHWVAVHSTNRRRANLLVSFGGEYNDSFDEPFGGELGQRHHPSIFTDTDGSRWLVWGCTKIAILNADLSAFDGAEHRIGPSDRALGHEGSSLIKFGDKYVLFGSAWSTDLVGQGTYNLYYCTSDRLTGPYGPRQFAARFCGHGTVFQDAKKRWWTTACGKGIYESDPSKGQQICGNKQAWTRNPQGLTLVPMELRLVKDGKVDVRAKDSHYANPGPEEAQPFTLGTD